MCMSGGCGGGNSVRRTNQKSSTAKPYTPKKNTVTQMFSGGSRISTPMSGTTPSIKFGGRNR